MLPRGHIASKLTGKSPGERDSLVVLAHRRHLWTPWCYGCPDNYRVTVAWEVFSLELSRKILQLSPGCCIVHWAISQRTEIPVSTGVAEAVRGAVMPAPTRLPGGMALRPHSQLHHIFCFAFWGISRILMMLLNRRFPLKSHFFCLSPLTHLGQKKWNESQKLTVMLAEPFDSTDWGRNRFYQHSNSLPTTNAAVSVASFPHCGFTARKEEKEGPGFIKTHSHQKY